MVNPREWVDETAGLFEDPVILLDGYDDAIVGMTTTGSIIYDEDKILEILMEDGSSREDAADYYSYNVLGSLRQEDGWPVIMKRPE